MNLSGMSFFQLASDRMRWLGARQSVISENVANADTPNYRAKEVASFRQMLDESASGGGAGGLRTTDAQHIHGMAGQAAGVTVVDDPTAIEGGMDGNTVSLEQQTIKAAEVSGNYRLAADLYKKGHDLLTLAVTGIR